MHSLVEKFLVCVQAAPLRGDKSPGARDRPCGSEIEQLCQSWLKWPTVLIPPILSLPREMIARALTPFTTTLALAAEAGMRTPYEGAMVCTSGVGAVVLCEMHVWEREGKCVCV